ncbi:MAG: nucleoside-diphosphate kinase [Dehalococcoidia bacterium]|nr:nucleoside-diphosphate kinase [Chloroflexota bacterium]MCH2305186.1 nucleoside-diphosphate kinase [SAR202 cluster bacterium]|tara:strand:- start:2270 stop:2722 length:453 start_codon:yes stop_codon:yes gene_type:complete
MEKTLILLKPDSLQRGLSGEIISRFEKKGFKIIGMKLIKVSKDLAETHYSEHKGKPFFEDLVAFITSSPIIAMVIETQNAINIARNMMGSTNPIDALPGTIRGDFGISVEYNIIHGSDSETSAKREISLFFNEKELIEYSKPIQKWITGD